MSTNNTFNKTNGRYIFDPKTKFKNYGSTGFIGLKIINEKGRLDDVMELDNKNLTTRTSLNKIKENTIKEMYLIKFIQFSILSGKTIPNRWTVKSDFGNLFVNLIDKDDEVNRYMHINEIIKKRKINIPVNLEKLLHTSSMKNINLSTPISGVRRMIDDNTARSVSQDSSTINENEVNKFNKINENYYQIESSNLEDISNFPKKNFSSSNKKENFNSTIQRDSKYSLNNKLNVFPLKEPLMAIKENFDIISEEENNEFLITGMKNKILTNFDKKFIDDNKIENIDNINHSKFENSSNSRNNLGGLKILKNSEKFSYEKNESNEQISRSVLKTKKFSTKYQSLYKDKNDIPINFSPEKNKDNYYIKEDNLISPKKNLMSEILNDINIINKKSDKFNRRNKNDLSNSVGKNFPKIKYNFPKIITHTIIDYSVNRPDFISNLKLKNENKNIFNNNLTEPKNKEKLNIKNEKIKEMLEKSKKKGAYAPYFSMCKNCNTRNNDFYNHINSKDAIGIIKVLNKEDFDKYHFGKF